MNILESIKKGGLPVLIVAGLIVGTLIALLNDSLSLTFGAIIGLIGAVIVSFILSTMHNNDKKTQASKDT